MTTRRLKRIAINGAGTLVALVALFPVYWMVLTSFGYSALKTPATSAGAILMHRGRRPLCFQPRWTASTSGCA